jgi:hypothetical protein
LSLRKSVARNPQLPSRARRLLRAWLHELTLNALVEISATPPDIAPSAIICHRLQRADSPLVGCRRIFIISFTFASRHEKK